MYEALITGITHFGKKRIDLSIATQAQLKMLYDAGLTDVVKKVEKAKKEKE